MLNKEFKVTTGMVMVFKAKVKNEAYLYKFGEGFHYYYEVTIIPEPELARSKCEMYYTVDGSNRKYYLIEFYVQDNENLATSVDEMLEVVKHQIDWEKMIADIERDAEEAWEDVEK